MQSLWFNPTGSKCGKKASGKIEFRLAQIRKSMPSIEKKNTMTKPKTDTEMV